MAYHFLSEKSSDNGVAPSKDRGRVSLNPNREPGHHTHTHTRAYVYMYGWIDGWMDGWMEGWMDGYVKKSHDQRKTRVHGRMTNDYFRFSATRCSVLQSSMKKNIDR